MFSVDLRIFLLICFSLKMVCSREDIQNPNSLSSDIIYSPMKIYQHPPKNAIQAYLYFPDEDRYVPVDYHQQPAPFKRPLSHPMSSRLIVNNHKKVSPELFQRNQNYFHPIPIKKLETPQPVPIKMFEAPKPIPLRVHSEAVKSDKGVLTVSEQGKKYEDAYHKKHGYKTNEGYDKKSNFDKGQKAEYVKEEKSGDEKAEKGSKKSDHEDHKDEESHNKEEEKEKGEKYHAKKQHHKGSKSKGYHNIFMKDEYKKDHIFFDKADETGHYSKHGSEHTKYHDDEHKLLKGAHKDAGHESDSKKNESLNEKKEYDAADVGYKKEAKHISYDNDNKDYLNNAKSAYNVAIKHI